MDKLMELVAAKLSPRRFRHSTGVAQVAVELAEKNGLSPHKAFAAGMVHDYARELQVEQLEGLARKLGVEDEISLNQPELLHAPVGAYLIKEELGIDDPEIIQAVSSHTLGRRKMGRLEQIIYLADMIEPHRVYPGVEDLRQIARVGLQQGILGALDHTIKYLVEIGKPIHIRTLEARNYLIMGGKSV